MKQFICTVCPRGCRLTVNSNLSVTGNSCPRGVEYGQNEAVNPMRILTSTVFIEGGIQRRLPVRTDKPVPKGRLFECMESIKKHKAKSPVKTGQLLIKNIANTGANLIATKSM